MYKRILVATDGSTRSKKAVRNAIDLAGAIGADLVALYVVPRYPVSYFEGGVTISMQDVEQTEKQWSDKGQAVVDAVQQTAQAEGIKAKAVVVRSDLVAESIMSAAKKHKCDLVVMASHGRKGIKRVLLGSETQHVLTHSTVPVLVLR
jgi:nucleotide-binding universal stress UspA family protein